MQLITIGFRVRYRSGTMPITMESETALARLQVRWRTRDAT
jgi:hypothetical protein